MSSTFLVMEYCFVVDLHAFSGSQEQLSLFTYTINCHSTQIYIPNLQLFVVIIWWFLIAPYALKTSLNKCKQLSESNMNFFFALFL